MARIDLFSRFEAGSEARASSYEIRFQGYHAWCAVPVRVGGRIPL